MSGYVLSLYDDRWLASAGGIPDLPVIVHADYDGTGSSILTAEWCHQVLGPGGDPVVGI